jgi:hypothetical protein
MYETTDLHSVDVVNEAVTVSRDNKAVDVVNETIIAITVTK